MTPLDEDFNSQNLNLENNNTENQLVSQYKPEKQLDFIQVPAQENEAIDPLSRRVDHSYQILAAAVVRANQAKTELKTRIHQAQVQIEQSQQKLTQLSEQLLDEAVEVAPQNEQEAIQQLHIMKGCVRDKHHNNLLIRLNELHQADHLAMPTIIDAMRAELDLIEIRTQKIRILEDLKEAYKSCQYFQGYYQRADEEFKKLLAQY